MERGQPESLVFDSLDLSKCSVERRRLPEKAFGAFRPEIEKSRPPDRRGADPGDGIFRQLELAGTKESLGDGDPQLVLLAGKQPLAGDLQIGEVPSIDTQPGSERPEDPDCRRDRLTPSAGHDRRQLVGPFMKLGQHRPCGDRRGELFQGGEILEMAHHVLKLVRTSLRQDLGDLI
ncbi:MAG TPA: hypothetical protein VLQ45_21165, partial [Thermoanaerobaculia bacterium]|nr:hypothetical protein [Thermoanaerobaculia bacterium]